MKQSLLNSGINLQSLKYFLAMDSKHKNDADVREAIMLA